MFNEAIPGIKNMHRSNDYGTVGHIEEVAMAHARLARHGEDLRANAARSGRHFVDAMRQCGHFLIVRPPGATPAIVPLHTDDFATDFFIPQKLSVARPVSSQVFTSISADRAASN